MKYLTVVTIYKLKQKYNPTDRQLIGKSGANTHTHTSTHTRTHMHTHTTHIPIPVHTLRQIHPHPQMHPHPPHPHPHTLLEPSLTKYLLVFWRIFMTGGM